MLLYWNCIMQGFLEKQVHWLPVELNEITLVKEIMNK